MNGIIEAIIKAMANQVLNLGFVSKSGGMLQETTIVSGGGNIVRTAAQIAPFVDGKIVDISPDKKETVITFFSAGATRVVRQDTYLMLCENEIVLTGWINGNRTGTTDQADPEMQILTALRNARLDPTSGGALRSLDIEFAGSDSEVQVSRWGWDKPEFQYGAAPHRFFQQRFRASYMLSRGCSTQSVVIMNPAC